MLTTYCSGSREEDRSGRRGNFQPFARGEETSGLPVSTLSPSRSETNNSNNSITAQENIRNQGRHLGTTSTEGSSTFRQAIWFFILKIWQKNAKYFLQYEFIIIPKEDEAEMLFGPPGLQAESQKVYGLLLEKVYSKVSLQI